MKRVLIRADASADWKIAGLRQLDRLALTLREIEPTTVAVQWDVAVSPAQRWWPNDCNEDASGAFDHVFTTHQLLRRKTLESMEISSADEIETAERKFLRGSGKSQDGMVSRFINRPISRAISQMLLKTSVTPSAWTLAIFVLPFIGAVSLARGDYLSVIVGMIVFQLYSILDGCDGEIARAKFLESEHGGRLDSLCDIASNLLLAIGLGWGLGGVFALEGVVVAALIAMNEWLLAVGKSRGAEKGPEAIDSPFYPRHRELLEKSGMGFLGEKYVWWLFQLTKRDVAMLFFLFLALIGQSGWILHLLGASTLVTLGLAALAKRSTR